MVYVLLLLGLAVAAALIYLATLPADFEVRRSLPMNADPRTVFDKVRDLKGWVDWSPWLMHEPNARLDYRGEIDREGGSYSWDGKRIGAGTLTHVRLSAPERIDQLLVFKRPFKSQAETWWEFALRDGHTEVTWSLRGRMPFLLRIAIPMLVRMTSKDFDLGLAMLRGAIDPQAERPRISFLGETRTEPLTALTIPFRGGLEDLVKAMDDGYPRLQEQVRVQGKTPTGPAFCAYHKANSKINRFECDIALPVSDDTASGSFALKRLGGGRHFCVELLGSYSFLELAWYSAIAHLRMSKIKLDGARPMLEVYEIDPRTVAHSNGIRTRLEVPIR